MTQICGAVTASRLSKRLCHPVCKALHVTESRLKRRLQPGLAAPRWLVIFLGCVGLPILAAPFKNAVVYQEPGRFGRWPANQGRVVVG